jgi:hypothetical protein
LPRDSVAHPVKALGLYIAGHHRVDRSVVWRKLDRRGVHEAELAGFARTIVGPSGVAGDWARDGRCHNNAPLAFGLHGRQAGFDREEGAFEVGAKHLVPGLRRQLVQLCRRKDSGISTQNVNAAELRRRLRGDALCVRPA